MGADSTAHCCAACLPCLMRKRYRDLIGGQFRLGGAIIPCRWGYWSGVCMLERILPFQWNLLLGGKQTDQRVL